MSLPENDRVLVSKAKFEQDLSAMLAGRVAEEMILSDVTNGAVDDLGRVTKLARAMVTQYGMSEKMGPMVFGQRHELIFLGRDIGEQRNYSEQVAREIDKEVNLIVTAAYERAKDILNRHKALHQAISQRLIEVETMDAEEFEAFFVDVPEAPPMHKIVPDEDAKSAAPATTRNGGAAVAGSDRPSGSPNPRPAPA